MNEWDQILVSFIYKTWLVHMIYSKLQISNNIFLETRGFLLVLFSVLLISCVCVHVCVRVHVLKSVSKHCYTKHTYTSREAQSIKHTPPHKRKGIKHTYAILNTSKFTHTCKSAMYCKHIRHKTTHTQQYTNRNTTHIDTQSHTLTLAVLFGSKDPHSKANAQK